jgi:hypothetical protein
MGETVISARLPYSQPLRPLWPKKENSLWQTNYVSQSSASA